MAHCIIIPVRQSKPLARADFVSLSDFQKAVGGWVELVTLHERFALLVNEEGHVRDLPINRRATLLLRLHVPAARETSAIVGDVVLVGGPSNEEFGDVPRDLDQLLLETRRYVVKASSGPDDMRSSPVDSFWQATEIALVAELTGVLQRAEVVPFE